MPQRAVQLISNQSNRGTQIMKYDYNKVNVDNIQKLHDFVPKIKNLAMGKYTEGMEFDLAAAQSSPEHPCETAAC